MGNKTVRNDVEFNLANINKTIKDYINKDKSPSFYFQNGKVNNKINMSIKDFVSSEVCEASIHIIDKIFSKLIYKEANSTLYFPSTVYNAIEKKINLADNILWIDHYIDKFNINYEKKNKHSIYISSIHPDEVDSMNIFEEKTIEAKKIESNEIIRYNFINRVYNRKSEKTIGTLTTKQYEKSKGALFVKHVSEKHKILDQSNIDMYKKLTQPCI
jgi:hypothetical protein